MMTVQRILIIVSVRFSSFDFMVVMAANYCVFFVLNLMSYVNSKEMLVLATPIDPE